MPKPGGCMGHILRVDLTSGNILIETLDEKTLRKYPGGALGAKILYDEVSPNVKALDPENKVIFSTNPFAGSAAPATSLCNIVTKGAQSNLLTSSQANGFFAARLKFAGFDAIIIEGKAPEWQYLYINSNNVELRDARHLVGKDTIETEVFLKKELKLKKTSVVSIGLAGENLVRFAAIQSNKGHFASTNRTGAVMGSKKLKAIVVSGETQHQDEGEAVDVSEDEPMKAYDYKTQGRDQQTIKPLPDTHKRVGLSDVILELLK